MSEQDRKRAEINRRKAKVAEIQGSEIGNDGDKHEAVFNAQLDLMSAQLDMVDDIVNAQSGILKDQKENILNPMNAEVLENKEKITDLNRRGKKLLRS